MAEILHLVDNFLTNSMKRWMQLRKYLADQSIYFGELVLSNLVENIDQYSIAQSLLKNFGAWKVQASEIYFITFLPCSWSVLLFALLIELPVSWNTSLKCAQTYLTRKTVATFMWAKSFWQIWRYMIKVNHIQTRPNALGMSEPVKP